MNNFKKGLYIVLAGGFLAAVVSSIAIPQGAVTLVQLVLGGTLVSSSNPLPVTSASYPTASTPVTGNSTGTTGAVTGSLAGVSNKTTYICGFNVSAIGGTAAVGPITIAGTITASLVYELASTASGNSVTQTFTPCIPASAANTAITITTTADGTASAVAVNSWGYQQ